LRTRFLPVLLELFVVNVACAPFARTQEFPYRLTAAPLRVDLTPPPGISHTEPIHVLNDGEGPAHMKAFVADWHFNQFDAPQYVPAGKQPEFSCGSWVKINPTEFEVQAHSSQQIRFTIRAPQEVKEGGYHCAVVIETTPVPAPRLPSSGLRTQLRFATSVYAVVGNPRPEAEFAELTARRLPPGKPEGGRPAPPEQRWEFQMQIANTGQTHFRVSGTLEVKDSQGKSVETFKLENQPVLPQSQRPFTFVSDRPLEPGSYKLVGTIDVGLKALLQTEREIQVEAAPLQSPTP
jgi:hypothetical protein